MPGFVVHRSSSATPTQVGASVSTQQVIAPQPQNGVVARRAAGHNGCWISEGDRIGRHATVVVGDRDGIAARREAA